MTSSEIKHVPKGWGYEKWIVNGELYCGKLLFFEKGKRCSWHYHKIKDETFYIQSGELLLIYGEDSDIEKAKMVVLKPGDILYIPARSYHQAQPTGKRLSCSIPMQHMIPHLKTIDREYVPIPRTSKTSNT